MIGLLAGFQITGNRCMRKFLKRRFVVPVLIGLTLTLLAVSVKIIEVPVLSELDRRLEWLAYDLRR